MGYETMKLIVDIIFGVCMLGIGLYFLISPYEKLKAKMPKLKSKKMVKTCGILLVILGIASAAMALLG